MKKNLLAVVLLILVTTPITWPLFRPGFFTTHDADWMTIRLSAFHQALRDGQFPVRFVMRLNHEFGYPLFNFIYPLPFYLGEIAYLLVRQFSTAVKIVFAASIYGSALTMFLWLKSRFGTLTSLAAASLYAYTPYRLLDIYVRGSIGEAIGFVFVPLIFWSIDRLQKRQPFSLILGAVAFSLTILSHNVFIIFAILGLIYGMIIYPQQKLRLLAMMLLGAMLSAYFWFPAISEIKYVRLSQIQVTNPIDHLGSLRELIIPRWGYEAMGSAVNPMSIQIGLVNLSILVLAGWLLYKSRLSLEARFFFIVSIIAILAMHHVSGFLWKLFPAATIIQHPWRLLSLTTFATAFLAAVVTSTIKNRLFAIGIIAAAVGLTISYARPQSVRLIDDSFFSTNEDSTTIWNEYMPLWVATLPTERVGNRVLFTMGRGFATDISKNNLEMGFKLEASEDSTINVPIIYYPGWQANINGKNVPIDYGDNGTISVDVTKGVSMVSFRWRETSSRTAANFVSLITLLAIISHISCTLFWLPSSRSPKVKLQKSR